MPATVPAKAILLGEHAVVYPGNSAVVVPVTSATCTVSVVPDHRRGLSASELQCYLVNAREAHENYDRTSDIHLLEKYQAPAAYLTLVTAIGAEYLTSRGLVARPVRLEVASQIPYGGMGSSAAVAASTLQAYSWYHGIELSIADWHELTLRAERFQHGRPSGADVAAVVRQQPILLTKKTSGKSTVRTLGSRKAWQPLLRNYYVVHMGRPQQSTADMIDHVRLRHEQDPSLVPAIEANTRTFMNRQKAGSLSSEVLRDLINENGLLLEHLGVATKVALDISRRVRALGGAAKVSGAGGLGDSPGGALVISLPDQPLLQELIKRFEVFNV